jgi:hypothetical protein
LLIWAVLISAPPAQCHQKFLRRFFQKAAVFFQASQGAGQLCHNAAKNASSPLPFSAE